MTKPYIPLSHSSRKWKHGHWTGWLYEPCWRSNIYLIWPVTEKQVEAYIKREFGLDYHRSTFGGSCIEILDQRNAERAQVIALRQWRGGALDIGILAHEAFHAAEHILSNRGVRLTKETTEPFAYLLQEITDRCLQLITNKPR